MSDSTRSGNVGHERAARAPELVVEADAGRKGEKARRHPGAQVLEGPGAVALEAQQVLEGLETDSIRWRIRPRRIVPSGSSARAGRTMSAPRPATAASNSRPA